MSFLTKNIIMRMEKSILKFTLLSITISSLFYCKVSLSEDYFDPNMIDNVSGSQTKIDLSVFYAGGQLAGTYLSAVYVNGNYVITENIRYEHLNNVSQLFPMLTKADYIRLGVSPNATFEFINLSDNEIIQDIQQIIPDAFVQYHFETARLNISIPQQYILKVAKGTVPEELWDDGVNAFFVNYAYSGALIKNQYSSTRQNYAYLNLQSGLNLGSWRLRNYSTYSHSDSKSKWKNVKTYLERDIKSLKSQLLIGESYTPSALFDSFSFRGIKLVSDDSMLPSSLRGFAPVIRGIAQSNAQVTIRQNGGIIWQSYVPPGAFEINDLYPTTASGDLEVTIKESDGSTKSFIQPFSAVPIMLREGGFKYSLAIGEYYSHIENELTPNFIQATGIYGLSNDYTIYSGAIVSNRYHSLLFGVGKSLGELGSISLDATFANSKIDGENNLGSSVRFQYSKEMLSTGTSFSLAGYRYSTAKYRDFSESNSHYNGYSNDYASWVNSQRQRDKLQIHINQKLGDYGSLYLTGYQQQYWGNSGKERNINIGYNTSYKGISYSANYSYSRGMYEDSKDQLFSFSVQIPFDFFNNNSSWLGFSASSSNQGNSSILSTLSGTALKGNNLDYSIQQGYTNRDVGEMGGISVGYKTGFGEYQLGYNYTRDTQQINYSARGGVVIHPYGVTLSQSLGDTMALVVAEDAKDIALLNHTGISTDVWGNAVVPYVSPYQKNDISLDTSTLAANVDILKNAKMVVPSRGAIVVANYPTSIGYKIFLTLQGAEIPFGAKAVVDNNGVESTGIVTDGQKVYLSGVPQAGTIYVTWSNGQCAADYNLVDKKEDVILLSLQCNNRK